MLKNDMTPCLGWCQLSTSDKCPSCNEAFPSWLLTQKKMKKSLMTLDLRLHFSHNWFVIDWYGQGAISRRLSVLMWWGNLSAAPAPELLKYFYRSQSRSRGKSSVYPETYFDRNITTPTDQQTLKHLRRQSWENLRLQWQKTSTWWSILTDVKKS